MATRVSRLLVKTQPIPSGTAFAVSHVSATYPYYEVSL